MPGTGNAETARRYAAAWAAQAHVRFRPLPADESPAGLARVAARTLAVETIGSLPLPNEPAYELCDLKGSGDARLYAFCSTERFRSPAAQAGHIELPFHSAPPR